MTKVKMPDLDQMQVDLDKVTPGMSGHSWSRPEVTADPGQRSQLIHIRGHIWSRLYLPVFELCQRLTLSTLSMYMPVAEPADEMLNRRYSDTDFARMRTEAIAAADANMKVKAKKKAGQRWDLTFVAIVTLFHRTINDILPYSFNAIPP